MNKKTIIFSLIIVILLSSMIYLIVFNSKQNNYYPKKIILGSTDSVDIPWLFILPCHIAYDDNHNIYVLEKISKKIIKYDHSGIQILTIPLKNVDFSDKSEELGDEGFIAYVLEVSSDGKYYYITEGGMEYNWAIIDSNGKPLKKNVKLKWIVRKCNNTLVTENSPVEIEVDSNLNIIKKRNIVSKINTINLNNSYYELIPNINNNSSFVLLNKLYNEKVLVKKEVNGKALRLLGTDSDNNVYVLLEKPLRIIKMDTNFDVISLISLPDDQFFKESLCVHFSILCDGTIYCEPNYCALWNHKERKVSDMFYIYKFEMRNIAKLKNSITKFYKTHFDR